MHRHIPHFQTCACTPTLLDSRHQLIFQDSGQKSSSTMVFSGLPSPGQGHSTLVCNDSLAGTAGPVPSMFLQHPHHSEHLNCCGAQLQISFFRHRNLLRKHGAYFGAASDRRWDSRGCLYRQRVGVKAKLLIWPLDNSIVGSGSLLPSFFLLQPVDIVSSWSPNAAAGPGITHTVDNTV